MSQDRSTDLLGALPRTRPHRRSDKRDARPADRKPSPEKAPASKASASRASASKPPARKAPPATSKARKPAGARPQKRLRQPAQPAGVPRTPRAPTRKPAPTSSAEIVGTAVQAIGELAEIGLALSARALRNAASRLPRP